MKIDTHDCPKWMVDAGQYRPITVYYRAHCCAPTCAYYEARHATTVGDLPLPPGPGYMQDGPYCLLYHQHLRIAMGEHGKKPKPPGSIQKVYRCKLCLIQNGYGDLKTYGR
jgi:hypothetical protein